MKQWEHETIMVDGKPVKAQAPVIVSASRSTDIPAFYADWFFHRLERGYSAWTNPFNGVKSYVSYAKTRFIVFWSKNPRPLLDHLHVLKEKGIGCYIQYTLNDYRAEGLEQVPPLAERIGTFRSMVDMLGLGSVVWRFDPMILTDDVCIDDLLRKVRDIGDRLQGYTEKLVFSYADIALYKKVKSNLERDGIPYHEWTVEQMVEFAQKLSRMNLERGWNFSLATCAEKIDLERYGIEHNRCIDCDLITRLAWQDRELMDFMKVEIKPMPQPTFFDDTESLLPKGAIKLPFNRYFMKDAGQRSLCGCMAAKDIGQYNTCPHLCEYCYANSSKELAMRNWGNHQENKYSDTITGQ